MHTLNGLEEIQISICGKYMFYYSEFRDYCVFSTDHMGD
jgi:hypothetical protein